jgi:ribonuclease HI
MMSPQDTVPAEPRPHVEIFTDGGCDPNPGPGGFGVVLCHPRKRLELSGGFRRTTNNRMEILAAIQGLERLKQPCNVVLYSDSQYLVNAMTKGWALAWKKRDWWRTNQDRAANADLWARLLDLCATHSVQFRWIRGHAGNAENERCDQLSTVALHQPNLPADTGYEQPPIVGSRPRPTLEGQPCLNCSTPVVKRQRNKRPKGDYYHEYYLGCPKCQATYEVEAARRKIEPPPTLL